MTKQEILKKLCEQEKETCELAHKALMEDNTRYKICLGTTEEAERPRKGHESARKIGKRVRHDEKKNFSTWKYPWKYPSTKNKK